MQQCAGLIAQYQDHNPSSCSQQCLTTLTHDQMVSVAHWSVKPSRTPDLRLQTCFSGWNFWWLMFYLCKAHLHRPNTTADTANDSSWFPAGMFRLCHIVHFGHIPTFSIRLFAATWTDVVHVQTENQWFCYKQTMLIDKRWELWSALVEKASPAFSTVADSLIIHSQQSLYIDNNQLCNLL